MSDHDDASGDHAATEVQKDLARPLPAAMRRRPELRYRDTRGEHTVTLTGRVVVGSAPHVDMQVADPTVSRLHAELELRDDGVWARDLESRNGTFVDHVRVVSARLDEGARLRVGSSTLQVSYGREAAPVELWPLDRFGPLLGRSVVMRELFATLAKVARTDSTVLIQGETGVGKELVAQAIHDASRRAKGPFVVVDCASMPENLLEAELFGHARGAFTGAVASRAGMVEVARGGTLVLDEVGELPLSLQPKLLRLLESRTMRRIGDSTTQPVDVRFVAATHRDLGALVNGGSFREDLYFRLAVLPVHVAPLRDRIEDVPMLVERLLPEGATLPADAMSEVMSRRWMGNVRELRNFVERAVALGAGAALRMTDASASRAAGAALPPVSVERPFKDLREEWNDHLEREYMRAMLVRHGGNVSAVAIASGIDRTYVHRLIRKHDLG